MLHDADCGFCTRVAALVPRLRVQVEDAALQDVDLDALGIPTERAVREMPFVHPAGRVEYGHRAWAAILESGPLPCRAAGRLVRLGGPISARVYRWVAEHRERLPGGSPQCSIEDR